MANKSLLWIGIIGFALIAGWLARDIGFSSGPNPSHAVHHYNSEGQPSEPSAAVADEPSWSPGPRNDAHENADYHWRKHGREFSNDRNEQDYVTDAERFVRHPPPGALTKQDSRGDTLIYDPGSNTSAVRAPDGAPRTMFKPHNGEAYWNRK